MKSDWNFCQIFCIFFRRVFIKISNIKFHNVLPVGTELINTGRPAACFRDLHEGALNFNNRGYLTYC